MKNIEKIKNTIKEGPDSQKIANHSSLDILDLFKFLASLLIFSMHFEALSDYPPADHYLELIARWGVPFFFISSGFLLFRKSQNGKITKQALVHYTKRVATLYFIWFIINFPYILYKRIYVRGFFEIDTWITFLKESILSSSFFGSWFLVSCIFSAWLVYSMSRIVRAGTIILLSLPLYVLCVLTSAYHTWIDPEIYRFLHFLNFPLNIFNGCLFFAIGKYIADHQEKLLRRFSRTACILLAVVFYVAFYFEIEWSQCMSANKSTDAAFCLIPIAFYIFMFCLQCKTKIRFHITLRKLSTIIYCAQGSVLCVWGIGGQVLKISSSLMLFAISALAMAIVCVFVLFLQQRAKWSWRQYLT